MSKETSVRDTYYTGQKVISVFDQKTGNVIWTKVVAVDGPTGITLDKDEATQIPLGDKDK
jgi:hypothetical protein